MVKVSITSADISNLLQQMVQQQISVFDVQRTADLSVSFSINEKYLPILQKLVNKRGDKIKILKFGFIYQIIYFAFRRPVFLVGMLFILVISLYLPTRVLFVEVEGNKNISSNLILQKAEECGMRFAASRRMVRSEQMKNSLLSSIPQLQWVGVNTRGCVAVISVTEKDSTQMNEQHGSVSSIVSVSDGIITDIVVRKGDLKCHVGQAVQAGDLLVSGYTDCGLTIQAQEADGEIQAQTMRNLEMIMPVDYNKRGDKIEHKRKYAVQFGKKLINLYIGSGISDSSCVKMYSKKNIILPGGLQLPISLITVEYISYTTAQTILAKEQGSDLLRSSSRKYLQTQMMAGQILQENVLLLDEAARYRLTGEFVCTEMIGRIIYEESIYKNGKDN